MIFVAGKLILLIIIALTAKADYSSIRGCVNCFDSRDTCPVGIDFVDNLSWNQIFKKAKKENKYIFIDCYTTWCKPCRLMEKTVFCSSIVGEFLNNDFVSVRIQMDTTQYDNNNIKNWYSKAHELMNKYQILAFPTFLFFSPDGKLVHRDVSFKGEYQFIELASDACDSARQLYTLLEVYNNKMLEYDLMPYLANKLKRIGDENNSFIIANKYIDEYLLVSNKADVYEKENLKFVLSFVKGSNGGGYKFIYKNRKKIDSLMGQVGICERVTESVINNDFIKPKLEECKRKSSEPDWNEIYARLKRDFDEADASKILLNAKIQWFSDKNDWNNLGKLYVVKIEKYGLDTSGMGKFFLNNTIYEVVFQHVTDKKVIEKSIKWMEVILSALPNEPICIDSYANLLYKAGRRKEAIEWEQKAVTLEESKTKLDSRAVPNNAYKETLYKMRNNIPTWSNN